MKSSQRYSSVSRKTPFTQVACVMLVRTGLPAALSVVTMTFNALLSASAAGGSFDIIDSIPTTTACIFSAAPVRPGIIWLTRPLALRSPSRACSLRWRSLFSTDSQY